MQRASSEVPQPLRRGFVVRRPDNACAFWIV